MREKKVYDKTQNGQQGCLCIEGEDTASCVIKLARTGRGLKIMH